MAAAKRSPKAAAKPEPTVSDSIDDLLAAQGYVGDEKPIGPNGEIRPVRIGKRGRTPNPMVDLFELDGVMYQIPSAPPPILVFRYQQDVLRAMRVKDDKRREAAHYEATTKFLTSLLGQEAMDALAESPDTTEEDIADVFAIVSRIAFGSKVMEAQGN